MSKVLHNEVKKVIYRNVRALVGIRCDICERIALAEINNGKWPVYFEVTTGHNDWGNDSCESVEHQDICPDCINKFVAEYLSHVNGTSKYIEIETVHVYPKDIQE